MPIVLLSIFTPPRVEVEAVGNVYSDISFFKAYLDKSGLFNKSA